MFIASITEVALHTTDFFSSSANHTHKHHSYLRRRHEYINTGKLLNTSNCEAVLGIQLGCRHSAKCPQATLSSDLDLHSLLPQPVIQQHSMVTGHSHHLIFYAFESFDLPCWYTTLSASVWLFESKNCTHFVIRFLCLVTCTRKDKKSWLPQVIKCVRSQTHMHYTIA